jgi:hypothetical protein
MMTLFATLEPLEKTSHFAPLGIRFWDPAREVPVTGGLWVTIRPPHRPDLMRRAFQTWSGIYAFRNLPGLRGLEVADPDLPPGVHPIDGSPPSLHRFVVEVEDRLDRFLPLTFQIDLPYRGIYPTGTTMSPPGSPLPGFFLFSAPSRTILADAVTLRARLVERLPDFRIRPASYAVLEVVTIESDSAAGSTPIVGIADERGSVLVTFPYPSFATSVGPMSPPPGPPMTRLQSWEAIVRVRYAPANQTRPDSAARLPELGAILTQPFARFLATAAGPGEFQLNTRIVFGQPLTLQTAGSSDLWLEP